MPKALVVDDSAAELASLRDILAGAGWQSTPASNGADALKKAKAEKPNLILLDIIMPDMDGYEALRQLKLDADTRDIPVVLVSSKNQKADHAYARMQGAKELIGKPYTAEQVFNALKAYG